LSPDELVRRNYRLIALTSTPNRRSNAGEVAVQVAPRPGELLERHRPTASRPERRGFRKVAVGKRSK
jgi:hypothetical protein